MVDRVLVTGAAGYLGRCTMDALAARGLEPVGLVRREVADLTHRVVRCDLADTESVRAEVAALRPAAVIHAAAWIGADSIKPETLAAAVAGNITTTASIVAASLAAGVPRLVHCSTVEVYADQPLDGRAHREDDAPHPRGPYGCSKLAAEAVVAMLAGSPTSSVVLRMPGLHGWPRRGGLVHRLLRAASDGEPVDLAEPETRLSFLWVGDAARVAVAAAVGELGAERCLNVANSDMTLAQLARCVEQAAGVRLEIRAGSAAARNRALDVTRLAAVLPAAQALPLFEQRLADELARVRAAA